MNVETTCLSIYVDLALLFMTLTEGGSWGFLCHQAERCSARAPVPAILSLCFAPLPLFQDLRAEEAGKL